jgi:glyoxylase-like metal-dependent hydrolase (beta-lactamase superfamily II)
MPIVILCCVTFNALGQDEDKTASIGDSITITRIDEVAYLVVHQVPFGRVRVSCNSLLVRVSDANFVWCGTPCEPASTNLVYEWTIKNFGDVNLIEINTGFHNDNLGGNEFLLSKGVAVYGSDVTAKLILERGPEEKEKIIKSFAETDNTPYYQACRKMTFMPPNHTFELSKGLKLEFSKETVEVYYPGPSHTIDNTVVYFHNRRILFGGCMVKALDSKDAGYTADADMQKWPRSVEKVLARYKDAKIVVPGHGNYGDTGLLKHTIELLDKVNNQVKK